MLIPVCMATMYLALLFIQNILPFLTGSNPRLIPHNKPALTIFGRCEQYTIYSIVYLIGNQAALAKVN